MGASTLERNTTGASNVAIGHATLTKNTTGLSNTGCGSRSLFENTTGSYNVATGGALGKNTTGNSNVGTGFFALNENTTGDHNTAVGNRALYAITTGIRNTAIGNNAGPLVGNGAITNATALGNNAVVTASDQVRIGNSSVTSIGGYANWTNISDGRFKKKVKEDVPGLDFIKRLRPVSYQLDRKAIDKHLGLRTEEADLEKNNWQNSGRQTGFIAQEVEKAVLASGTTFSGIDVPGDQDKSYYGIRYAEFVVPLVKAVQELNTLLDKQNAIIARQQEQIYQLMQATSNVSSVGTEVLAPEKFQLFQNQPNPFSQNTEISLLLPEEVQEARIMIFDLKGQLLLSIPVESRGQTSVSLNGGQLAAGMYTYSLVADQTIIDSKKMVLTP